MCGHAASGNSELLETQCFIVALFPLVTDAEDALVAFRENESGLNAEDRREARWLLWKATADNKHLSHAKQLVEESVTGVPDDVRTSMLRNLRLHRDITAAWEEYGKAG